jgi:hypothetical protein
MSNVPQTIEVKAERRIDVTIEFITRFIIPRRKK